MSIAVGGGAGIGGPGFVRGIGCVAIYESAGIEERKRMDRSPPPPLQTEAAEASSSSSSIGEDSDEAGSREEDEEEEVQSACKGPLHGMQSLEESLPIRRGISSFYNGKSKSFTSLSDAAASVSAKDMSKDENAYTRKRRNLLALKTMLERPHTMLKSSTAGINKKPTAPARCALAVAAALSVSPRLRNGDNHHQQNFLPPRPGKSAAAIAHAVCVGSPSSQQFPFPSRSFSLGDLSQIASVGSHAEAGSG